MKKIVWDGQKMARQGDILLTPITEAWLKKNSFIQIPLFNALEVPAIDGSIRLQEGEVSGHHHMIPQPVYFRDDGVGQASFKASSMLSVTFDSLGLRNTLGVLEVKDKPVLLTHPEHTALEIPPGKYRVVRQSEERAQTRVAVFD
jgi:hypothetical protein